jgi:hypothetical protein
MRPVSYGVLLVAAAADLQWEGGEVGAGLR